MTQPLALVLYEKLLPGSQIVNRLQDLNYRVQAIAEASRLVECAEQAKPMLVLADLESTRNNVCAVLARLKQNAATRHLPVIAFSARSRGGAAGGRQGGGGHLGCQRDGHFEPPAPDSRPGPPSRVKPPADYAENKRLTALITAAISSGQV